MATRLGRIYQFDASLEQWQQYVDHLGHFMDANGIIDEGKKRSVFLSVIGRGMYKLLTSPSKPGAKGFDDPVKTLTDHSECHKHICTSSMTSFTQF